MSSVYKNLIKLIKGFSVVVKVEQIALLGFIAVFSSQTLVDITDLLVVLFGLYTAYRSKNIKNLLLGLGTVYLWPIWLVIILVGLQQNLGLKAVSTWVNFSEFRWILSLLCLVYLFKKIECRYYIHKLAKVIGALNIISLLIYVYKSEVRAGGIIDAIMAFSHNIAPLFCLFLIVSIFNFNSFNKQERYLYLFVAATSGLLTLLTYTRGVWIGSIVSIILVLFIWNIRKSLSIIFFTSIASMILIFAVPSIYNRVFSKTIAETSSNNARLALWKANLLMVRDHKLVGVGLNQNKHYLSMYFPELGVVPGTVIISHAHNQYLQLWAGTGTLGLICYLYFLFLTIRTTWLGFKYSSQENKGLILGLLSAIICFLIGSLTEANFNISKNRFLFLLLVGMAVGFSNRILESKSETSRK